MLAAMTRMLAPLIAAVAASSATAQQQALPTLRYDWPERMKAY